MKKILNNNVLLKLPIGEVFKDRITFKSGHTLLLPTDQNEVRNTINPRWEVELAPEYLTYKKVLRPKIDLDTKVDIEIKKGDFVFVSHSKLQEALGKYANKIQKDQNPTCYEEDGFMFIMVQYVRIILVERGEELHPLNGKLICEILEREEPKSGLIIIPDAYKQQTKQLTKARIVYKGNDPTEIFDFKTEKWVLKMGGELNVGDIIYFKAKMEGKIDYTISSNEDLVFVDNCHVFGKEIE